LKLHIQLTENAQRLIAQMGHIEFSTEVEQGVSMPGVGDLIRITMTEPPMYMQVVERRYDFTTSPATVTLLVGAKP
jgi:hypothetical protein